MYFQIALGLQFLSGKILIQEAVSPIDSIHSAHSSCATRSVNTRSRRKALLQFEILSGFHYNQSTFLTKWRCTKPPTAVSMSTLYSWDGTVLRSTKPMWQYWKSCIWFTTIRKYLNIWIQTWVRRSTAAFDSFKIVLFKMKYCTLLTSFTFQPSHGSSQQNVRKETHMDLFTYEQETLLERLCLTC